MLGEGNNKGNILIVGAGPAGLATALELRSLGMDITILERAESCTALDPERAFLYLIDGRGQKFTDAHGLTPILEEQGVPGSEFKLTICRPSKPRETTSLNLVDDQKLTPYWIPRDRFVTILADAVRSAGSAAAASGQQIRLMEGWELAALERAGTAGGTIRATIRRVGGNGGAGDEEEMIPVISNTHAQRSLRADNRFSISHDSHCLPYTSHPTPPACPPHIY
jgi:2-polyprenyl-6-methoxyphenol hydroxylase-like FAD-dependent oxidoreductase